MRILALQLKRIGDLVLTTPAFAAIKARLPQAHLALAVHSATASLLPAISDWESAIVFGPGRGFAPWQQVLTGRFDAVLDFTGTDRSALAAALSRAKKRAAFTWVRKSRLRSLAYGDFVESSVRERHTVDHYLDLLAALDLTAADRQDAHPILRLPEPVTDEPPFAIIHPGTARPEKFWLADRWAEVAGHLSEKHGLHVVITSSSDPAERAHAGQIRAPHSALRTPATLCDFASLLAQARIVVSCDTAAVHLAAAFRRPQIALYGPTNPFHWRPRHDRALVISATKPGAPLSEFDPWAKGAPMDRISTEVVCRAIDDLLSHSAETASP
jgi:ADP-heptose:LPS heptosyltransferase